MRLYAGRRELRERIFCVRLRRHERRRERPGDGRRCAASRARSAMRALAVIFLCIRGVVVTIGTVVRVLVVLAGCVIVMPERHTLACDNRCHTLERNRQAQ